MTGVEWLGSQIQQWIENLHYGCVLESYILLVFFVVNSHRQNSKRVRHCRSWNRKTSDASRASRKQKERCSESIVFASRMTAQGTEMLGTEMIGTEMIGTEMLGTEMIGTEMMQSC